MFALGVALHKILKRYTGIRERRWTFSDTLNQSKNPIWFTLPVLTCIDEQTLHIVFGGIPNYEEFSHGARNSKVV